VALPLSALPDVNYTPRSEKQELFRVLAAAEAVRFLDRVLGLWTMGVLFPARRRALGDISGRPRTC
jgi:hypothetical protein